MKTIFKFLMLSILISVATINCTPSLNPPENIYMAGLSAPVYFHPRITYSLESSGELIDFMPKDKWTYIIDKKERISVDWKHETIDSFKLVLPKSLLLDGKTSDQFSFKSDDNLEFFSIVSILDDFSAINDKTSFLTAQFEIAYLDWLPKDSTVKMQEKFTNLISFKTNEKLLCSTIIYSSEKKELKLLSIFGMRDNIIFLIRYIVDMKSTRINFAEIIFTEIVNHLLFNEKVVVPDATKFENLEPYTW